MDGASRKFGWSNMFVAPDSDPRADGDFANDERSMLLGYLSDRRLTFKLKCADLDARAMAAQPVPPSDLSLLGLLRHLTEMERHWFRREMEGQDVDDLYGGDDFAGVRPDERLVATAAAARRCARSFCT